jgi:coiled-coil domain-containing protein 55
MENKKFGLFIQKKEEKKPKSFLDDLEDDDDEDDHDTKNKSFSIKEEINKNILKQQQYNALKISEEMSRNLLDDPNFYEYDAVYEEINPKNKIKKNFNDRDDRDDGDKQKPKYLGAILAATEKRKIEQSIIKERVERKKREREVGEYGDKPKFITRAYEEKMKSNKNKEIQQDIKEKYNEKNTVNSEFGMMGFYSNLLTKNSAYAKTENEEEDYLSTYKDKIRTYERNVNHEDEGEGEREKIKNKIVDKIVDKSLPEKSEEKIETDNVQSVESKEPSEPVKKEVDLEEYKKRYLERKRNRNNEIENKNE